MYKERIREFKIQRGSCSPYLTSLHNPPIVSVNPITIESQLRHDHLNHHHFRHRLPFCYLGRARLSRAIALYRKTVPGVSSSTFKIRWHACRLYVNPPAESVLVTNGAAKKFGADRLVAKRERMSQLGAQEGFTFTFSERIGNTRIA